MAKTSPEKLAAALRANLKKRKSAKAAPIPADQAPAKKPSGAGPG